MSGPKKNPTRDAVKIAMQRMVSSPPEAERGETGPKTMLIDQIAAANPWLQPWGKAVPRVIKRVSIIVNVRCDRTGLWYDTVSSLATCCWPVVGRRSPRKTSTMTEGTNCRLPVVRRETGGADLSQTLQRLSPSGARPWSAGLSEGQPWEKYRIPRKRVMRRCQDTGRERTPVARGNPRSP